jgi:hypothetical protein
MPGGWKRAVAGEGNMIGAREVDWLQVVLMAVAAISIVALIAVDLFG